MKNQIKGIAIILFGILLTVAAIPLTFGALALIGGAIGLIGLFVVFWNGDWKDGHQ